MPAHNSPADAFRSAMGMAHLSYLIFPSTLAAHPAGALRRSVFDQALQHADESRTRRLKLLQVMQRQLTQRFLAFSGQLDQNPAFVIRGAQADQRSSFHEPVDKSHGAVMLQLHSLGQNTHGRLHSVGQSLYGQQQLVLPRLDPRLSRGVLAEPQKATNLITQLRHRLIFLMIESCHNLYRDTILSRYDAKNKRYPGGLLGIDHGISKFYFVFQRDILSAIAIRTVQITETTKPMAAMRP